MNNEYTDQYTRSMTTLRDETFFEFNIKVFNNKLLGILIDIL